MLFHVATGNSPRSRYAWNTYGVGVRKQGRHIALVAGRSQKTREGTTFSVVMLAVYLFERVIKSLRFLISQ